ncbi:MAG: AAA family ATPase [bacterium]|nr:AAA family ATPase [bacterium]
MDSEFSRPELHLPDLSISGFRGIENLAIGKLGRVTLLAGRNGVGKSTVLDAVRVYAGQSDPTILDIVLDERGEVLQVASADAHPLDVPDYLALFHRRATARCETVSIGSPGLGRLLTLAACRMSELEVAERKLLNGDNDPETLVIKVCFGDSVTFFPVPIAEGRSLTWNTPGRSRSGRRGVRRSDDSPTPIKCQSLGPDVPGDYAMLEAWANVALTADEDRAVEALRPIHGDGIERVAFVGGGGARSRGARAIVKLRGHPDPVPLRSLGDGATRMFAAALALATCRDGFLLIDEAENGIHHQIQEDYWRLILLTAAINNVQVLATTHSWDCVGGFARAAAALDEVEGRLVRLERRGEQTRAVEYDEDLLETVADQRIEVR